MRLETTTKKVRPELSDVNSKFETLMFVVLPYPPCNVVVVIIIIIIIICYYFF
jgi:hypothetical protein